MGLVSSSVSSGLLLISHRWAFHAGSSALSAAVVRRGFTCQHGSKKVPGVKRTNFNIQCKVLSLSCLHKSAQREVWRHGHWVRNTWFLSVPWGGKTSRESWGVAPHPAGADGAMALAKEVYELYPHALTTLGTLCQVFGYKIPWNVTKCVPTGTGCRGKRGGSGGTLLKWPGSASKLGSKGMENSLINKMMWNWITA